MISSKYIFEHYYLNSNFPKNKIYEPDEDTFLFLNVLENIYENNCKNINFNSVCEVGVGNGLISTFVLLNFSKEFKKAYIGIDINKDAINHVNTLWMNISIDFKLYKSDLFNDLNNEKYFFSLILFNPPYVPGDPLEILDDADLAWNGLNEDGDVVIRRFLTEAVYYLEECGKILILLEARNKPESIIYDYQDLYRNCGVIGERKVRCEHLFIYLLEKK